MRSLLLLFLGVPIPIIILIAIFLRWPAREPSGSLLFWRRCRSCSITTLMRVTALYPPPRR